MLGRCIGILFLSFTLYAAALSPPYFSVNRQNVANVLNTLASQGLLPPSLQALYAQLSGFDPALLNDALDTLHPAQYSALAEVQAALGGQTLSLFHRWQNMGCGSLNEWRVWAVPMGNWLNEGDLDGQTGFEAITKGVALGFDKTLDKNWSIGAGFVWNETDLIWHLNRGKGTVNRFLGAVYSDFAMECFICGMSLYCGVDYNDIDREISFANVNSVPQSSFSSLDLAGQFSAAYLFGFPYFFLYPYANFDTLYLRESAFSESGARSLDLNVESQGSVTIRTEAGIGFKLQDANLNETVCISPTVAFGWAMECPVLRSDYTASFAGTPLTFQAEGWDHTWQLLSVDFALAISIYDFVISGEYLTESAPKGRFDFWSQRGNLRLEYSW